MGLDIFLMTTNQEDLYPAAYDYYEEHRLSRTFCHLMLRPGNVMAEEEPELEQIGRLTQVDIAPLYAMNRYPGELELDFRVQYAADEQERLTILHQREVDKAALEGNLVTVRTTLDTLIAQLSVLPDVATQLRSTWGRDAYFSNFTQEPSEEDGDDHFGHDLRNFRRFLDFAQAHGSTTVYFDYE